MHSYNRICTLKKRGIVARKLNMKKCKSYIDIIDMYVYIDKVVNL